MANEFTTPGAIKLKSEMPTQASKDAFELYRPLDKPAMAELVRTLVKHGGPGAMEHVNSLAKTFFGRATEIGASTPLSDYINDSDERDALIKEYDTKVHLLLNGPDTKQVKNQKLTDLTGSYNTKISDQNLSFLLGKGSTAAMMASSGARGKPEQLASGTSTPLMSLNVKGELIPVVIKHSFAQGMTPAEMIALSYMGRSSTVLSQLSTALPGALFKKLSPTVFHEVVTIVDCGTKNGISVPITDKKSLLGRFLRGTSTMIDDDELKSLELNGVKKVGVRSVMTCEAKDGVCQRCFGLMANRVLPEIGTNVGVIAAQSVSEVLTQAMLSTKHKATVGERKGNAYEQANNLLSNPSENFTNEATLSTLNGEVTAIRPTALGDNHVYVNEKMHFVPIDQNLKVKVGDHVQIGQPLSTGTLNPRTLVGLRGIGAGREYMAKELRDIYGGGLDPRHFELIAKNLIKYVEIVDPGQTAFLPGEKVDVNQVRKYLETKSSELPVDRAEGKVLAKGVFSLTPGTLLDANHIQQLKDDGVKTVSVSNSGLKVRPIVPGLQSAKMLDRDWVSKLSFSRLRDTLKESAAVGAESDVHSVSPITSYVLGHEFGEGKEGKY
jgi:DNA-directed RNA polymerase subunit beta'